MEDAKGVSLAGSLTSPKTEDSTVWRNPGGEYRGYTGNIYMYIYIYIGGHWKRKWTLLFKV